MISFEPTEDQQLMQGAVADFAQQMFFPRVREHERLRGLSEEVRRAAHAMGLGLVTVPESCGGQGQGLCSALLVEEELGAADAAAAFALAGPQTFGRVVQELGTNEQIERLLSGFSGDEAWDTFGAVAWSESDVCRERVGFATTAAAVEGGYRLTGKKAFVGNAALADRFVVFAQVELEAGWRGIGAFVVRRDNPGLRVVSRHETLGLDAASFGEVELDAALVSEDDRLLGETSEDGFVRGVLRFFTKHSLVVAARGLGLARFAFELAREHCDTRVAFGKPIGHFQAVAFTLADRAMDVESSRCLLLRAAHAWDAGLPEREALLASARASAHVLEAAMRAADDCVQLHGGSGFIRDLVAEKLMRDAKQLMLSAPTTTLLDQLASVVELGLPLDPAFVLPTPDMQAIFT